MHHSSGQNSKELAIGNDLGRRGSLLVPPHKPHSIGCCDAQSTSATGRCCRKSPRHPTARNNRIIGLDFLNRTCAFENQYCSESPQNLFSTASVKGCLRDDVGCTSGIPQIADDLLHCPSWQSRADAVEKVRSILLTRNNRIRGVDFLSRTCAFDAHFESMLLGEPSKIVFRQHRPNADITANAETQPRAIISIERDQCHENRGRWIYQRLQGRTKGIALLLLNAAPIMLCSRLPVIPDWLRGATALMCRDLRGFTGA